MLAWLVMRELSEDNAGTLHVGHSSVTLGLKNKLKFDSMNMPNLFFNVRVVLLYTIVKQLNPIA